MEMVGIVVACVALVIVIKFWNRSNDYVETKLDEATALAKLDARENLQKRVNKLKSKYGNNGLSSWEDLLEMAESDMRGNK